jgi:hypothetical protein
MEDNSIQGSIKKRNIRVDVNGGNENVEAMLINVLHVPRIAKNLFFVMNTTSLGHVIEFGKKGCVITNNQKKVVALDVKKISLFKL